MMRRAFGEAAPIGRSILHDASGRRRRIMVSSSSHRHAQRQQQQQQIPRNMPSLRRKSSTCVPASRRRGASQQQQQQQHSTSTMDFANSCPSIVNSTDAVQKPGTQALKTLFVASAIPMVGFGFMDNFVMIQAGQYIDSTLGVSLGLATMTAAAAGQVVSDVSGVVFGGTLERFLTKMKFIRTPALSTAQRQLPVCRNVAMAGAVLGVIVGCALGATTLLFVDLDARDRIQRAQNLRDIVQDMIAENSVSYFPCQSCTVYVTAAEEFTLPALTANDSTSRSRSSSTTTTTTRLSSLRDASDKGVDRCVQKREIVLANNDTVMYAPVLKKEELVAVVAFRYGDKEATADGFREEDVLTARVMARHIAIIMDRLVE